MPEGPEVETVRRTLEPQLLGHSFDSYILSDKTLRSKTKPHLDEIVGHNVIKLGRHGKILWIDLGEKSIVVQLGMSGRLLVVPKDKELQAHTHVRISFFDSELRYIDPRRFGDVRVLSHSDREAQIRRLGPDPLQWQGSDQKQIVDQIKRRHRSIKDLLLDQNILAGVGNIYASEALFGAGIHPKTIGSALSDKRLFHLLESVERVLKSAVQNNGTTFSNYVDGTGKAGSNFGHLNVFQQVGKPCKICGSAIRRMVQGGRSTFYCATCQRS